MNIFSGFKLLLTQWASSCKNTSALQTSIIIALISNFEGFVDSTQLFNVYDILSVTNPIQFLSSTIGSITLKIFGCLNFESSIVIFFSCSIIFFWFPPKFFNFFFSKTNIETGIFLCLCVALYTFHSKLNPNLRNGFFSALYCLNNSVPIYFLIWNK